MAMDDPTAAKKWFDLSAELTRLPRAKFEVSALRTFIKRATEGFSVGAKAPIIPAEDKVVVACLALTSMVEVLHNSMNEGTCPLLVGDVCDLIHVAESILLEHDCNGSNPPTDRWGQSILPLFTILSRALDVHINPNIDSPSLKKLLVAIQNAVEYILKKDAYRKALYSNQHIHRFGQCVAHLLATFESSERGPRIRLLCLNILSMLLDAPGAMRHASACLPATATKLNNAACQQEVVNIFIVEKSLELFKNIVIKTLGNLSDKSEPPDDHVEELDEQLAKLVVNRNDSWKDDSSKRIVNMLAHFGSRLAVHRDASVRFQLLDMVDSIRTQCSVVFKDSVDGVELDVILMFLADVDPKVRAACDMALQFFQSERVSFLSTFGHTRLTEMAGRLPSEIRNSDPQPVLDQLWGMFRIFPLDSLIARNDQTITNLIQSLASAIRIDRTRLAICRNPSDRDITEFLLSLPLENNVRMERIAAISKELATYGTGLYPVISSLLDSSSPDCHGLLVLFCLIVLNDLSPSEIRDHNLGCIVEFALEELTKIPRNDIENDQDVQEESVSNSTETITAFLLLSAIGAGTSNMHNATKQKMVTNYTLVTGVLKLLIDVLYTVLEWSALTNFLVREAASCALTAIARGNGQSVGDLLTRNGSLIVSRVSLGVRVCDARCACVLSSLLDRVPSPSLFPVSHLVIIELLDLLDRKNLDWSLSVLRAIRSFARALNNWFPNIRIPEQENVKPVKEKKKKEDVDSDDENIDLNEEKPPLPESIAIAEQILKRTQHLLSSTHFPVRMCVLVILEEVLWTVREYDDVLLPMAHQNWSALKSRMSDSELTSRTAAFQVISRMSVVCGSFIGSRFVSEVWPGVCEWMLAERKKGAQWQHSAIYKYQAAVLKGCGVIFPSIGMVDPRVLPMLREYVSDHKHSRHLRNLAQNAVKAIE